jgi:uncharacterized protein
LLNTLNQGDRVKEKNLSRPLACYVPARDGTRLAVDVWLPPLGPEQKAPTLLRATRYHRASENASGEPEQDTNFESARLFNRRGYVLVVVDARGSGASFGHREGELTDQELADYADILSWVTEQPWSNGCVGTFGSSYDGDTAELIVGLGHPALKAAAPLYNDFDVYEELLYPGGILNLGFVKEWFTANALLDEKPGSLQTTMAALEMTSLGDFRQQFPRVKPVDGEEGEALREAAILDHARNVDASPWLIDLYCKDDRRGGFSYQNTTLAQQQKIEKAGVPLFILAGWLDAGTVAGTLTRFATFSNPQEVWIGPWSHGGGENTDPFLPPDSSMPIAFEEQRDLMLEFFDRHLHDTPLVGPQKRLHFYINGEGVWRETSSFPPQGVTKQRWFLGDGQRLQASPGGDAADSFEVDFEAGGGERDRWIGQTGGDGARYQDRGAAKGIFSYTTSPLEQSLRIIGFPVLSFELASTTSDGALHAYLETVAPDGSVVYISEGMVRLVHRKVSVDVSRPTLRVPRSYARADLSPMPLNQRETVCFDLFPTATLIPKGYCLRVSLAGHDHYRFARYPSEGTPTYTMFHQGSYLELPVEEVS